MLNCPSTYIPNYPPPTYPPTYTPTYVRTYQPYVPTSPAQPSQAIPNQVTSSNLSPVPSQCSVCYISVLWGLYQNKCVQRSHWGHSAVALASHWAHFWI